MDLDAIFLAYDIRGKVPDELNSETAFLIGKAMADFLPTEGAVAVGRDMRPDSGELAASVARGLMEQGRDVVDVGQVTSDMIYFTVGSKELAGGAMVTASHNPGAYNGIKLVRDRAQGISIESGLTEIRDNIKGQKFKPTNHPGKRQRADVIDAWIDHVLSFVKGIDMKPFKVAIDAGNGMAGAIIPHLEPKVPFKITPLYFELDGTFPNHEANPLKTETLKDLQQTITKNNLDVGVAFDGDGDRAVLVDETGEPVPGSIMTAMLAEYFLQKEPKATILYNLICSRIVPETIKKLGGKAYRTRVGHTFIKNDMRDQNGLFAGEHSSHFYFRDNYNADSGLIAAIVGLGVLSQSGKKLSELVAKYRVYTQSGEINFAVEDKEAMINKISTHFKDGTQDRLDGLTVSYDDWWFNVRPSNTEPLLRLNVEAKDSGTIKAKISEVENLINS